MARRTIKLAIRVFYDESMAARKMQDYNDGDPAGVGGLTFAEACLAEAVSNIEYEFGYSADAEVTGEVVED